DVDLIAPQLMAGPVGPVGMDEDQPKSQGRKQARHRTARRGRHEARPAGETEERLVRILSAAAATPHRPPVYTRPFVSTRDTFGSDGPQNNPGSTTIALALFERVDRLRVERDDHSMQRRWTFGP